MGVSSCATPEDSVLAPENEVRSIQQDDNRTTIAIVDIRLKPGRTGRYRFGLKSICKFIIAPLFTLTPNDDAWNLDTRLQHTITIVTGRLRCE